VKKKRKIRAITAFEVIQGYRGRYQSKARMQLPIMFTGIISRTVSELSQLIVQILDTLRFRATLWRLRDNVRCSSWAHWKRVVDFLLVLIELFSLGVTDESLRAK